ncbi:uncharacterized protein LOC141589782 [Silene latifolia]|uniref:uncharacterized protein LOC141589782 n=1 Tax=Silene latifolia TaxID=37657 RepID=UPI003D780FAD
MSKDGTDTSTPPPKIDVMSPYYLGSHDIPSQTVTHVKLRSDNYEEWSRSMRMSLKSRRKFGFCDGSIPKPTDNFHLEQWEVVHCTLVQWIMHSIDSSIKDSISYFEDARLLWDELAERFSTVDGSKIHGIKSDLHDCKQAKGMSVTTYFGNLKVLWDAIANYEPPFACKCGRCTCNIDKDALARQDSERLHTFLMGLDRSIYGNLRSQLLSLDTLPTLNRAFQLVLQEERLRVGDTSSKEEPSEVMAFAVRDASKAVATTDWRALRELEKQERRKLTCAHCSAPGHDASSCFIKSQKFPEWWGDRPRTLEEVRARSRANTGSAASTSSRSSGRVNAVLSNPSSSSDDRLSGMFLDWIIDTGASHHVTGDITWLTGSHSIPACPIRLPNGQGVSATIAGTVWLSDSLFLSHVLYVPSLTCNLLSVSQLVEATDYVVSFGANSCYIQDPSSRTRIGVGELRDGLYFLRVVGRPAAVHATKGDKFARRSRKCVFLGYPYNKKGWKVYDLSTGDMFVSRDVYFYENSFPYSSPTPARATPSPASPLMDDEPEENPPVHPPIEEPPVTELPDTDPPEANPSEVETSPSTAQPISTSSEDMGRGRRIKIPSTRLRGFVVGTTADPESAPSSPESSSSPSSSSGTSYALANYINCHKFSTPHRHFLAAITEGIEPPSFRVAITDLKWCQAMQDEITALEKNGTWELTDLPSDKKALGCRWVYKIKYKSNGEIERYKARLVIFGNHQVEGIDYGETFAPVVKMVTVRALLAVAAARNWELHQMDVHNAFLHGDLSEEVYMRLPPGFSKGKEGKFYGREVCIHVLVYVDDLVIAGNNSAAIASFKSYLSRCFHMKDLGTLKYFLGIEVARSSEGIFLNQRKYALDIITETGLLGAKPVATPIEQHHQLGVATGELLSDVESYRHLVGRLVYLAVTRPDLSYAVHILSRFLHQPRRDHMDAALRVVRYLKGKPGQGILLRSDSDLQVSGWCDSDYAGCPQTRRSVSGWIVFLGASPISWKTKKQQTVSLSSAEAEYRSIANVLCELKWLRGLLASLGIPSSKPMPIYCDSKSALHLAHNPVFHERTKHIEVDCHFIRDAITDGIVTASHVDTQSQLADIFTKALGSVQFESLLRKLGVLDLHAPV